MNWHWGHIWTDQDYSTAMADSDCYNMFVEAIMERLEVIGYWLWLGQDLQDELVTPVTPDAGIWSTYLSRGPTLTPGQGKFDSIRSRTDGPQSISYRFGRDWYKGMGETNMRTNVPEQWGWPYLQRLVNNIRLYFVRTIDENGSPIELQNKLVLPMVGSYGPSTPVPAPAYLHLPGGIYWNKYKYEFPFPNGWVRKYPRTISSTTEPGTNGEKARMIKNRPGPIDFSFDTQEWNDWGMRGWYFRKESNAWKHDPNILDADQVETRGLIALGDTPGPWILNNLRDAINQLMWTWSTSDYSSSSSPYLLSTAYVFNGRDKIYVRSDSGTFKGQTSTGSTGPNDSSFWSTNTQLTISRFLPGLVASYLDWKRIPGIFPPENYVVGHIAHPFGTETALSPGDPTGVTLESWPWPSYFNFDGNWRGSNNNPNEDPLAYTPYSEGRKRTIDFYSVPSFSFDFSIPPPRPRIEVGMKFLRSSTSDTWNWDYWNNRFNSADTIGKEFVVGVVKWDFKYTRNTKNATWKGYSDALLSSN